VLSTRLQPPAVAGGVIRRERLLRLLEPDPAVRLTAVTAAGGFGKTTLLGTWSQDRDAAPVAWLTLDENDDDSTVLWTDVLSALRRVLPDLEIASSACSIPEADVPEIVPVELVNELTERGDVVLMLDDLHRLSSHESLESVAWLAQNAPAGFHLIVSSRTEPSLPLATLRAHGALVEIGGDDLAFTVDEAVAYLNRHHRMALDRADVERLVEHTEGWPTGIHLAALSLSDAGDRRRAARGFSGRNRFVREFLADEMLGGDAAGQDLLLGASVLDRFNGPLCDTALGLDSSHQGLARLAATNLFLTPLDDEGHWYRFHRLVGEFLQEELSMRRPGAAEAIHRRAYLWHREQGSLDEAIHHALCAGCYGEAAELMTAAWPGYATGGRHAIMMSRFDRLPPTRLWSDQRLLLAYAWMLVAAGRPAEARGVASVVEDMGDLSAGPLGDGFRSIECSLETVRGLMHDGHIGAAVASGRRAVELEPTGSPWRATACYGLGTGLYLSGSLDEADSWLAEAVRLGRADGRWLLTSSAMAIASLVAGDRLRLDDQAHLAEQSIAMAREHALERVAYAPSLALGTCLSAQGRVEEALEPLERCIDMIRGGRSAMQAFALIQLAGALWTAGSKRAAENARAEAAALIRSHEDPGALHERLELLTRGWANGRRARGALTDRERTILRMLKGTLSERDIGRELYLSRNTIHSHTMSIYRKLGVSSRAEAVQQAERARLV
jgi:LuxR family maltose regulon positive regulatory protein